MTFIHELADWPNLTGRSDQIIDRLASVRYRQGKLNGRMESLGQKFQERARVQILADEVVSSSAVDHITLEVADVRASIAKKLGKDLRHWVPEPHVEAPVIVLLDAISNYLAPLTEDRLLGWHHSLTLADPAATPTGGTGQDMAEFFEWIEADISADPVLKAGLAHLWFMSVHPFSTGNYRIAAAITSLALARAEGCNRQCVSLSGQIRKSRNRYRDMVQEAKAGTLDVTESLIWFLDCLDKAITASEVILDKLHQKEQAEVQLSAMGLNDRQRRMLDLLRSGIENELKSGLWASMTNSSSDTAGRDIKKLVALGLLKKNQGRGRSTSYSLVEKPRRLG